VNEEETEGAISVHDGILKSGASISALGTLQGGNIRATMASLLPQSGSKVPPTPDPET